MKSRDKRRRRKEEEQWEKEREGRKIDAFVFSCRVDTMGKRKETKMYRRQIERRLLANRKVSYRTVEVRKKYYFISFSSILNSSCQICIKVT